MSTYTPDPVMQRYHIHTCQECGQLPTAHHGNGRCYTVEELGARLRYFRYTGAWPAPEAPCGAETSPPVARDALTVLRDALAYYRHFFGVDPAALPALEGQVALERLACQQEAAHAVVAAYAAVNSGATLGALSDAVHALAQVLGEDGDA